MSLKRHFLKFKILYVCLEGFCHILFKISTPIWEVWKCRNVLISFKTSSSLSLAVTPKQWENISDINIAKAERQKTNSVSLRALVESLLEQTAADMLKQIQATTEAFQLNVQEIKSAKSQMEEQLAKVG